MQPLQKLQHKINDLRFKVTAYSATIQGAATTAGDNGTGGGLTYTTPFFVATAAVECTTPANESFKVGFIQQCDAMSYRIEYPRAYTSWEISPLPVSDADGSDYPWYGSTTERVLVAGGATKSVVNVSMNDNFSPNVGYIDPVLGANDAGVGNPNGFQKWVVQSGGFRDAIRKITKLGTGHNLVMGLKRDQSFTTYLAARRLSDNHIFVLKRTTWRMEVKVKVTWTIAGNNATAAVQSKPVTAHKPSTWDGGPLNHINASCLIAPNANGAQRFMWTPKTGTPGARRRV